ncbi:flagellin N-terminal helical domain-containing protein [Pseudomonas oryzae]|uniref:Flagellin n=1 Tax=Pseudomonas oryzae TaxID=1392877 RepID=A0A1H1NV46_9PSED|nr:flagellin [Pseudomonas oryzae]SDS02842.1 flagellin [Pseudomonas oryzae]
MSVINTNITSVIAQKNLTSSKSALTTAMERLSSGLRINSAKDDAAGQAITNRMTAQVKGLAQAQRNANDGISVAQTAEGALNQVNDNLQRIRELSVQASNGTNSGDDLTSIQNEIGQRLEEINRISKETSFNGVNVLAGDKELSIQVGAQDGQTIKINLKEINAETLNLKGFNVDGKAEIANKAASLSDLKLASNVTEAVADKQYTLKTDNTAVSAADALGKLANAGTATFNGTNNAYGTAATGGTYTYDSAKDSFTYGATGVTETNAAAALTPKAGEAPRSAKIEIGGTAMDVLITNTGDITSKDGKALFIDSSGNLTATTSGTAGTDYVEATVGRLTNAMATDASDIDGNGFDVSTTDISTAKITLDDGSTLTGTNNAGVNVAGAKISRSELLAAAEANTAQDLSFQTTVGGVAAQTVTISSNGGTTTVKSGGNTVRADANGALTTAATTDTTLHVRDNGKVTDTDGVQYFVGQDGKLTTAETTKGTKTENPLKTIDAALKQIDSLRSDLGAVQNRFESAITNLSTNETNITAARSRIQDADYAVEVGNMTRAQILQQAGTSVLAQANQLPQGVLSLLR